MRIKEILPTSTWFNYKGLNGWTPIGKRIKSYSCVEKMDGHPGFFFAHIGLEGAKVYPVVIFGFSVDSPEATEELTKEAETHSNTLTKARIDKMIKSLSGLTKNKKE